MFFDYIETVRKSIYIGVFDSEKYWWNDSLAKLPSINDGESNNIVRAMDELQFIFCKQEDTLVTRFRMDSAHKNYLSTIGYSFSSNDTDIEERNNAGNMQKNKSVFQLIAEKENKNDLTQIMTGNAVLSTFAVIPFSSEVAKAYNIRFDSPDMEVIRKVNSKIYSTNLKDNIGIENISRIVNGCEELSTIASKYLNEQPIIIKDECGVSGKGNLFVNSQGILQRIVSYLANQEKNGKHVCFIIEPFLEKSFDFSCQFFISDSGTFNLLSLQKIHNTGFAYQGSFSADESLLRTLEKSGYFKLMEKIAECLYKDGYYGHVCIDSMILGSGEIVPVVEINARKSMSLIKHYMDRYLNSYSLIGNFTYISLAFQCLIKFEEVLERLESEGLLFKPGSNYGIIPLTANSLFINRDMDNAYNPQKSYKGRLYFSAVSKDVEGILDVTHKMKTFMENCNFKIQD